MENENSSSESSNELAFVVWAAFAVVGIHYVYTTYGVLVAALSLPIVSAVSLVASIIAIILLVLFIILLIGNVLLMVLPFYGIYTVLA